jgi:hypothetical protein
MIEVDVVELLFFREVLGGINGFILGDGKITVSIRHITAFTFRVRVWGLGCSSSLLHCAVYAQG